MVSASTYPETMKAVFLEKQGGPLIVRELKIPNPGPSEVLVKISAAPINPSDLARLRNAHMDHELSTFIPGLEGSGTVVAAGKGILPHLWLGKRVACSSKYGTSGTWAEYMVTPAAMCFPLNKKVSDEQGSMSLVNPLTALSFFEIIKKNKHRAIINHPGASALGSMVELLGKKHKIPVINIVRNQKQAEILKEQGSLYILDSSSSSFIENLGLLATELRATVLFDSVCNMQLTAMAEVLPRNSTVIIYGNLSGEEDIKFNPRILIDKNIKIEGFFLGNKAKENGLYRNMMNLIEVGRLMSNNLKINIRAKFQLGRVQEAVDLYLNNMSGGKIILTP
jgi:NADPH:quinone reductase-like Zn-dependent oxidoreductase